MRQEAVANAQNVTLRKARLHTHHESDAAGMELALRSSHPFCLQKNG